MLCGKGIFGPTRVFLNESQKARIIDIVRSLNEGLFRTPVSGVGERTEPNAFKGFINDFSVFCRFLWLSLSFFILLYPSLFMFFTRDFTRSMKSIKIFNKSHSTLFFSPLYVQ